MPAPPALTKGRIRLAYAVAIVTDALQFLSGPFGWAGFDEALDLIAMVLTWRLLGFHPLLLPTVVLEFLPVSDMFPTWTGCVALVASRRRKQQDAAAQAFGDGPVIDV